jgi:hypothetical protein
MFEKILFHVGVVALDVVFGDWVIFIQIKSNNIFE